MSSTTYKVYITTDGFVPFTSTYETYTVDDPDNGTKAGQPIINYPGPNGEPHPFATAIPVGNGVFLTASHSYDLVRYNQEDRPVEFRARSSTIDGISVDQVDLRGWNIGNASAAGHPTEAVNDLSLLKANVSVPDDNLNPFIVFDSPSDFNRITSNDLMFFHGQATSVSLGSSATAYIPGQFELNIATEYGDSGGMAVFDIADGNKTQSYNVGVLSLRPEDSPTATFSSLRPEDYYKITTATKAGSGNDFLNLSPDLIYSSSDGRSIRSTGRRADIITQGDGDTIVVENGGDLINSGSGSNTVVAVMPSAQIDGSGTTFVVSPGDEMIVGAGKNDRLVVLADRLSTSANPHPGVNDLSSKSPILYLNGGIGNDNGDIMNANWSPWFAHQGESDVLSYTNWAVSYILDRTTGGNDLHILFSATDMSTVGTDDDVQSLWSSNITIRDFHEGDLGLNFTYISSFDPYQDPNVSFHNAALKYSQAETASTVVNDDPSDVWNGIYSSNAYNEADFGNVEARIEQNRLDYGAAAEPGRALTGDADDNILTGSLGSDVLKGGAGNDTLHGGVGKNEISGGLGRDTATYDGYRSDYDLGFGVDENSLIFNTVISNDTSHTTQDTLTSVEHIQFRDMDFDLGPSGQVFHFGTILHSMQTAGGTIYALYEGLLDHAPGALTLEAYSYNLTHGGAFNDVTQAVLSSAEGQAHYGSLSDAGYVQALYQNVLHRAADAGGQAYYEGLLQDGSSRASIAEQFVLSPEHGGALAGDFDQGLFVADQNAADVARLFYAVLGRAPDLAGLDQYRGSLENGASLQSVATSLLNSSEGIARSGQMTDAGFVDSLFEEALGRHADTGALTYYTGQLGAGSSRAEIATIIGDSGEAHTFHQMQIERGFLLS